MYLGQEIEFSHWAYIHFTENNGMAFGHEPDDEVRHVL